MSAQQYFGIDNFRQSDPARDMGQRGHFNCVNSFILLEHIFISDLPVVLNKIHSYAEELILLNVACYKSEALLPSGENVHNIVRHPQLCKAMVDNCNI